MFRDMGSQSHTWEAARSIIPGWSWLSLSSLPSRDLFVQTASNRDFYRQNTGVSLSSLQVLAQLHGLEQDSVASYGLVPYGMGRLEFKIHG